MPVRASCSQAWVDVELAGREPAEAGVLAATDAVLDPGVTTVRGFQILDGAAADRGVGGDDVMAQAFDGVEQVKLGAGVWSFPAHDQPGSGRQRGEDRRCDEVGDLDDLAPSRRAPSASNAGRRCCIQGAEAQLSCDRSRCQIARASSVNAAAIRSGADRSTASS